MRKKTSIIWSCSDEIFIDLVKKSRSMSELLRNFSLENKGNNFLTCKKRILHLNLDISHYLNRIDSSRASHTLSKDNFLSKLKKDSTYNRSHLKKYLIKFNLLPYVCKKCHNEGFWMEQKLSLQLEHINGIANDNRLENICFLCPNCHSQTNTFAGKKKRDKILKPSTLNPEWRKKDKILLRKYTRPSKEELEILLKNKPILEIAKQFKVKSDNTIRKWSKYYGLNHKLLSPYSNLVKI